MGQVALVSVRIDVHRLVLMLVSQCAEIIVCLLVTVIAIILVLILVPQIVIMVVLMNVQHNVNLDAQALVQ